MLSPDDLLTAFAAHQRFLGRAESTIEAYHGDLSTIFVAIGCDDLAAITQKDLMDWDMALAMRVGHQSRKRHRASLRAFFKFLLEEHGLQKLSLPALKDQPSDPFLIHPDDLVHILHAQNENDPVQARDGAIIAFLAASGARNSECRAMKLASVQLSADGKNFVAIIPTLKHGGVPRTVNFGNLDQSVDLVAAHFGIWLANRIRCEGGPHSLQLRKLPLFTDIRNPQRTIGSRGLDFAIRRAVARAGIPRLSQCTPHTFRHYFATRCYQNGMDLRVIQGYLGHASINTTYAYIHLSEKASGKQGREKGSTVGLPAKPSLALSGGQLRDILAPFFPRSPL